MGVVNTPDTRRDTPPADQPGHTPGHTPHRDIITAGQSAGTRAGTHRDTPQQSHRDTRWPTKWDTRSQDHDPRTVGLDWITRLKQRPDCPKCQSPRVLIGPAYDRHALKCMNCGHGWRSDT